LDLLPLKYTQAIRITGLTSYVTCYQTGADFFELRKPIRTAPVLNDCR